MLLHLRTRLNKRTGVLSVVAVTRFVFSARGAARRVETGHGVSKLTDNVAWHWLLDSNDGCSRRWAPSLPHPPRPARRPPSCPVCPVLSFCLYVHAKVANLTEPPQVLFGATLSSYYTFSRGPLCVVRTPRLAPADNGENDGRPDTWRGGEAEAAHRPCQIIGTIVVVVDIYSFRKCYLDPRNITMRCGASPSYKRRR